MLLTDSLVVRKIFEPLGRPTEAPTTAPARGSREFEFAFEFAESRLGSWIVVPERARAGRAMPRHFSLRAAEVDQRLLLLPLWRQHGPTLARELRFPSFVRATVFFTVGVERHDHHPDWRNAAAPRADGDRATIE